VTEPTPVPSRVPVVNIANALTMSRLLLIPVFLVALFGGDATDGLDGIDSTGSTGWRIVAAVVFGIASITDRLDGGIARRRGLVTDFGKIVDPIADKALTGSALIGLSLLGELTWWVTVLILIREVGVTLLRFWVIRHGVIPASRGGKTKTFAQAVAIGLYLLPLPVGFDPLLWTVMAIALALTVATGIDYVVRALRLRSRARRAHAVPPAVEQQRAAGTEPA
jgi:CDP-diacylglycerol---glycerol-3-phosphate 3-phosphatidyltransferase